jgi:hypothetical protein
MGPHVIVTTLAGPLPFEVPSRDKQKKSAARENIHGNRFNMGAD